MSKIGEWFKRWMFDRKEEKITITGFFDGWSLLHFFTFATIAHVVEIVHPFSWWVYAIGGSVIAYGWEIAEYFLQRKYPERWSNRCESWLNSWVSDPICDLLGVAVGVYIVKYYHGLSVLIKGII